MAKVLELVRRNVNEVEVVNEQKATGSGAMTGDFYAARASWEGCGRAAHDKE